MVGVSPLIHDFWRDEDPNERNNNLINFMKNVALAGGAIALMGVDDPWEASVPLPKPTLADRILKLSQRVAA